MSAPPVTVNAMTISDWIQVGAVLAAVVASILALVIATVDRRTQLRIAEQDRAHSRLALELEYAIRLSTNRNMGGSEDRAESKRLGAEAMALVGAVGERWVPRQYAHVMDGRTIAELEQAIDEKADGMPQWVQDRNEATIAVQSIIAEMYGNPAAPNRNVIA